MGPLPPSCSRSLPLILLLVLALSLPPSSVSSQRQRQAELRDGQQRQGEQRQAENRDGLQRQGGDRELTQWFYPAPPQPPPADIPTQQAEGRALLELKKALNNHPAFDGLNLTSAQSMQGISSGPWVTPTANNTPCTTNTKWAWVGCDESYRVESLNLNGANMASFNSSWQVNQAAPLKGYVPWDALKVLSHLDKFDIGLQSVSGNLSGIGGFPQMTNLSLYDNQFTGEIPDSVSTLTQLQDLRLSMNFLSGSIPLNLSALITLQSIELSANSISGSFPDSLSTLTNLVFMDLSSNPIRGALPDSWSTLTALTGLQLQFTGVSSGTVPPSWSSLTNLAKIGFTGCNMTGTYPATLTNLTNLDTIWLSSNQLYGQLPAAAFIPKLTQLYIDNNYFNGSGPANNNDALGLKDDGNCFSNASASTINRPPTECTSFYNNLYYGPYHGAPTTGSSSSSSSSSKTTIIIIVSVLVPLLVLSAAAAIFYYFFFFRRRTHLSKLFTKGLRQTSREFTLSELKQATQNWQASIGKGGYGTVYKAELKDGTVVAVKRLDQVSKQGDVEFIREVELLSRVHHRHLVNLLGFCAERGERALVYEYMAMGSLYEHLHGDSSKQFPLSWDSRCKIAIHVALGIEYLHYGADPPLIHRDIKSANILLSDDGYSKVADFGLCKEAPIGAAADGSEQLVPTATAVRGSFGYLDPEYVNTSILSEKSDVYSYGVVLLELITGHKSIHDWQPLAYWAEDYLADREKTPLMVDPKLEGNFDLDELYALCDIARTCVQDQSVNRPTIRDVAKALVENLGHGMTSFTGSQQDASSIITGSHTDASSMPSTTYTPSSAEPSNEFSHHNYSETLHWTPSASGTVPKSGGGLSVSTGAKGDRLPVPVPRRPEGPSKEEEEEEEEEE